MAEASTYWGTAGLEIELRIGVHSTCNVIQALILEYFAPSLNYHLTSTLTYLLLIARRFPYEFHHFPVV